MNSKTIKNRVKRIEKSLQKNIDISENNLNETYLNILEKCSNEDLDALVNCRIFEYDIQKEIEIFIKYCQNKEEEITNYIKESFKKRFDSLSLEDVKNRYSWISNIEKLEKYYKLVKTGKFEQAYLLQETFFQNISEYDLDALITSNINNRRAKTS